MALAQLFPKDNNGRKELLHTQAKRSAEVIETILRQNEKLFAIAYFTQHIRNYLLGQKFLIVTDHRALTWLYSFKEADGLLARWIEKLGQFDFEIKHKAGKKTLHADCLSRVPETEEQVKIYDQVNQVNTEDKNIWSSGLGKSVEQLNEHQNNASHLIILRNWTENGRRPQKKNMAGASRALRKFWTDFRNLQIEIDLIKRQKPIDEFNNLTQIVIQRSLIKEILPFLHEHCGHFGMAKTFGRVREQFYWPGMKKSCSRMGKFLRSMLSKEVSTPETHTQPDNVETKSSVLASRFGHYDTFT